MESCLFRKPLNKSLYDEQVLHVNVLVSTAQYNDIRRTGDNRGPIKIPSDQYRKSHYGDKTVLWPSYLHNGLSYTDKMRSL